MLSVNNYILILSVGIFVGILIPSVSSIKCYVCNEQEQPQCKDKPTEDLIEDCPKKLLLEPTGCTTVHSEDLNPITHRRSNNTKRDCYYGDPKLSPNFTLNLGCDEYIIYSFKPSKCTICVHDECNSSGKLFKISSITILFVSIFTLVKYIF